MLLWWYWERFFPSVLYSALVRRCWHVRSLVWIEALFLAVGVEGGAGHGFGEAADVVLKGVVVLFELFVVGFDVFDFFDEGVEAGLEFVGVAGRGVEFVS